MNEQDDKGRPRPPACLAASAKLLIIIDRRPVIAGCLCSWVSGLAAEFSVLAAETAEACQRDGLLDRASAFVLGTGVENPSQDAWLCSQVAWIRKHRTEVPLVVLGESSDARLAAAAVEDLKLDGFIPTSSVPDLAATALRLIIAGGRYVPQAHHDLTSRSLREPETRRSSMAQPRARLSAREEAVLDLVARGLSNKVIAHRLGMSQGTVKAHIHNIINKLNVHNRTEAAVARYTQAVNRPAPPMSAATPHVNNVVAIPGGL
jgi:DNA-binding NarL/FixJ family response regulator